MSSKFSLAIENFRESDLFWSFKHSPIAILALCVTIVLMFSALFAQLIAPFNPYDLASLDLMDAHMPPSFSEGGDSRFWLGTDDQGRDLFSTRNAWPYLGLCGRQTGRVHHARVRHHAQFPGHFDCAFN